LKDHVTLGYAATAHSAQGVTADSSYAIPGEGASRAMLYVAMTRGRRVVEGDTNWSTYQSRRTARCRRSWRDDGAVSQNLAGAMPGVCPTLWTTAGRLWGERN